MSRSGALDRIDVLLGTVTDPQFTSVIRGEPLSISGTPVVAFWITNRRTVQMTLANASSEVDFLIRCFFRMQSSQDVRESLELDMWDAMANIETALRSDTDLAGNVSDASFGEMTTAYLEVSGTVYRVVDIPYSVEILGETTITP